MYRKFVLESISLRREEFSSCDGFLYTVFIRLSAHLVGRKIIGR